MQKATAIQKCIIALGPGAINLLDKLSSEGEYKLDLKKIPRDFDIQDWAKVVKVFKEWPFRPEVRQNSSPSQHDLTSHITGPWD